MVTAVQTSAGDIFVCVQATPMIRGKLLIGQVPGLKSLARATAAPAAISARAGGKGVPRKRAQPGSSVATVGAGAKAPWSQNTSANSTPAALTASSSMGPAASAT